MMKRTFFCIVAMAALLAQPLFAKDEITEDKNGIHPYKVMDDYSEELAHWSIYLDGGVDRFDGDGPFGISKTPINIDFGLGVTYDFTPLWALSLDLGRTGYGLDVFKKDATQKYVGHLYNVGADLYFNFTNAFFPRREKTILNVSAFLGGGLAMYTLKDYQGKYFTKSDINSPVLDNNINIPTFSSENRAINCGPYANAGLLLSFNVTRTFDIGLKGYYTMFFTDYFDGAARPRISGVVDPDELARKQDAVNKNNDGHWSCDVQFRWNIEAKTKSHVRNFANFDVFNERLAKYWGEDGKQEQRVAQKDTLVISHKDTLVMKTEEVVAQVAQPREEDLYFVYFDNNKYTLNDQGHIDVQKMAAKLQRNPKACLELSGFCDNTGSDALNEKLAEKRAQTVRDELINVYGIDPERLVDLGRGKLSNVKDAFGPNRRVDMRLVEKEELEQIRAEKQRAAEEKVAAKEREEAERQAKVEEERLAKEAKAAAVKAQKDSIAAAKVARAAALKAQKDSIAAAKAAAVEAANQASTEAAAAAEADAEAETAAREKSLEERMSELQITWDTTHYIGMEVTAQNSTLAKYARKYYNNTNCWVYIYIANQDVIKTPSYIWPNTKLYMPELDEKQLKITKEEAFELAKTVGK